jgi:hypothetical protein
MINFNNGVPAPEERQTIEDLVELNSLVQIMLAVLCYHLMMTQTKPTIDTIQIDNLHEK